MIFIGEIGMKKVVAFLLAIVLMFSLSSCGLGSRVHLDRDSEARLIFNDIDVKLTDEEADKVIEIFDEAEKKDIFTNGVPSCGFSDDVALVIGLQRFCIAGDTCGTVQIGFSYIDLDKEDIEYIHKLFEKYGGHFPWI